MELFIYIITLMSHALNVMSFEERVLTDDNTLQYEIQVLRFKVENLENKVATLETKSDSSAVAFMSQLSQSLENPAKGRIVVFDDVITDIGHAYSSRTGVFRAPVDGNYVFILVATARGIPGDHMLHLLIKKNGHTIGYIFLDSNHDYYLKRTEVSVVTLTTGDEVYVQVDDVFGTHSLHGGAFHSHFSGFLIH